MPTSTAPEGTLTPQSANQSGETMHKLDPNNTGPTKMRNVRVPDELWEAAAAKANEEYDSLAAVIRRLLAGYVRGDIKP